MNDSSLDLIIFQQHIACCATSAKVAFKGGISVRFELKTDLNVRPMFLKWFNDFVLFYLVWENGH